jgi:hypothetical protein
VQAEQRILDWVLLFFYALVEFLVNLLEFSVDKELVGVEFNRVAHDLLEDEDSSQVLGELVKIIQVESVNEVGNVGVDELEHDQLANETVLIRASEPVVLNVDEVCDDGLVNLGEDNDVD